MPQGVFCSSAQPWLLLVSTLFPGCFGKRKKLLESLTGWHRFKLSRSSEEPRVQSDARLCKNISNYSAPSPSEEKGWMFVFPATKHLYKEFPKPKLPQVLPTASIMHGSCAGRLLPLLVFINHDLREGKNNLGVSGEAAVAVSLFSRELSPSRNDETHSCFQRF